MRLRNLAKINALERILIKVIFDCTGDFTEFCQVISVVERVTFKNIRFFSNIGEVF